MLFCLHAVGVSGRASEESCSPLGIASDAVRLAIPITFASGKNDQMTQVLRTFTYRQNCKIGADYKQILGSEDKMFPPSKIMMALRKK